MADSASASAIAVATLSRELFTFQNTSQVPKRLKRHVQSSVNDQAEWYEKILAAWREANPPPKTAEEAARLVIEALKGVQIADVEGFLYFYGLPLSNITPVEISGKTSTMWPVGVKYEFWTLPVDAKAVQDGDSMTVYVDAREEEVNSYVDGRWEASRRREYGMADAFHERIIDAGYRVLRIEGKEILARKYRIRLRGIDAPEHGMPYADEAKRNLTDLVKGKRVRILFYEQDQQYGRYVGDIYCNEIFVQEVMLKKGCAWHYVARWQRQARERRVGLWALPNPEMPWKWRKNNPRKNDNFWIVILILFIIISIYAAIKLD